MPTPLDTELRQAALDLIDELGQAPSSYNQVQKGNYSPTSDRAEVTYANLTSTVGKLSPPTVITHGYVRSETDLLNIGDAITFMAAQGAAVTPLVGDRIIFQGMTTKLWEVVRVLPLMSGEQIAAWQLYLKAVTEGGS